MKSRKSIFCVALAALMLFAFTACENNAPTSLWFNKTVKSIKPVAYPEVVFYNDTLISDPFTSADIKLQVVFDDNSVAEYNGLELGLTAKKQDAVKVSDYMVFTASYGAKDKLTTYDVTIPVYEAEITALDVSEAETTTIAENATSADVTTDGVKVVYTYNETSTIEKELTSGTIYLTSDFGLPKTGNVIDWADIEEGDTFDFTLDGGFATRNNLPADIELIGEWTLTVDTPVILPTNIVATASDEAADEIFVKDTLATVKYEVTFTYDDEEVTLDSATNQPATSGWKLSFKNYVGTYTFDKVEKVNDIIVVVEKNDDATVKGETTLSVDVLADYPVEFTVAYNEEAGKDVKWTPDTFVDPKYFTFTVKSWAASGGATYTGATAEEKAPTYDYSDFKGLTTIKLGTPADTQISPEFEMIDGGAQTKIATCPNAFKSVAE